jgi:hypothetical protein
MLVRGCAPLLDKRLKISPPLSGVQLYQLRAGSLLDQNQSINLYGIQIIVIGRKKLLEIICGFTKLEEL